ncbi:hypothetical protein LRS13_24320 [Svornostia abyssi]|uniref:Uncharacterized protein n=1 Tax=Svornostia abyssi TaxID=2898438 RepID=A0ABY5PGI3_9ACTN|nr:hypothetical protein LRS13_24320 [Parviterribacteraceae bacterium J379]
MKSLIRSSAAIFALSALSLGAVPAAHANNVGVCNQASPHWLGGGYVALDEPVDSPAARYTEDLGALPGQGKGLERAAANSPALTRCYYADPDADVY